jgi:hypothetical protein
MEESPELAECTKEKDSAFETLNKDQAEYDKQLLALSAAFLGVALAFVKDVVPLKDAVHLWVFDSALGLLLGCVCLVLGTFQYSIHGHFRLVEYWDKKREWLEAPEEKKARIAGELKRRWDWLSGMADRIKVVNRTSGVLFVAGIIFLVFFVGTNLHRAASSAPQPAQSSPKQATPGESKPMGKPGAENGTAAHNP